MVDRVDITIAKLKVEFDLVFAPPRRFDIRRHEGDIYVSVAARRGNTTVRAFEGNWDADDPHLEDAIRASLRECARDTALFAFDDRILTLVENDPLVRAVVHGGIAQNLSVREILVLVIEQQCDDRRRLARQCQHLLETSEVPVVLFKDGTVEETPK